MTFLNPFALFGLLAAAIPILLHLLNLRKLRTIEFSTLTFLKELQKTKIRRLKLRQILLLILRTLLVMLIVLAFARPTLRGTFAGSIGSHAKTTAVIILDDSYSMTVSDDQGELLKQAKQAAIGLLPLFKDGDEIFLVRLSSLAGSSSAYDVPLRDFTVLRRNIGEIRPTAVRRSLEEGLRIAAKLLAGTQNFNKEVYVLSDFQQGVIADEPEKSAAVEKLFSPETRFFLVPLGKRGVQNFGIESVTIPSSIFEKDKPFTVQARVGNFTGNDVQDHVISVFLNGTRVAERSIDIRRDAATPVEFSVAANSTGFVEGFVELESDEFQYDDRRYFVLQIPDRIRTLLVGTARDLQYARLALSTRTSTSESAVVLDEVPPLRMSSVEIKQADVIVLCTTQGFTAAQISELAAFVKGGGGLMLFPGAQIDPASFNALFAAGLSLPPLSAIDRPTGQPGGNGSFIEFEKTESQHPLFEGMFEPQGTQSLRRPSTTTSAQGIQLESPRIRSSARYATAPQSNPIITLTNGSAFLSEQRLGSGRLLLYAVPPTLEWSDFPTKGLFVPLLHRSVLYLARQQARSEEVLPGSEVVIRSNTPSTGPWTVRNPEKVDIVVSPVTQAFQQLVRFSATDLPGIYTVTAGTKPLQEFVVNLDPLESRIQKAKDAEIEAMLQQMGIGNSAVQREKNADNLGQTVLQSRFGVELWKYFLILALIVAIIELLVARSSKEKPLPVQ